MARYHYVVATVLTALTRPAALAAPDASFTAALNSDDMCRGPAGHSVCGVGFIQRRVAMVSSSLTNEEAVHVSPRKSRLGRHSARANADAGANMGVSMAESASSDQQTSSKTSGDVVPQHPYWEEQAERAEKHKHAKLVTSTSLAGSNASAEIVSAVNETELPLRDPFLSDTVMPPASGNTDNMMLAARNLTGPADIAASPEDGWLANITVARAANAVNNDGTMPSSANTTAAGETSTPTNTASPAARSNDNETAAPVHGQPAWLTEVASKDDERGGMGPESGHTFEHPKWLASCKTILLDVGSGNGDNIRRLFEPEEFELSNLLLTLQQAFRLPEDRKKPANESGLCALGMEPNPAFRKQLANLTNSYLANGWHVHFYPYAAWSADGAYPMRLQGEDGQPEGAHLATGWVKLARGEDRLTSMSLAGSSREAENATMVRTVDLGEFLQSVPRSIGIQMMLMDVQGAEYEVLAKLISNNMLCVHNVKSALVAPHDKGDVQHWHNTTKFTGRSFDDVNRRVEAQDCGGKRTPILPLDQFALPLRPSSA